MAGPIAHIYFAQQLQDRIPASSSDFHAYMMGNLFPDIRRLGVIEREHSHVKGLRFDDIATAKGSFLAGKLLHSWLDEARQSFIISSNIDGHLPDRYTSTIALKVCEDAALYEQITDVSNIAEQIGTSAQEELSLGIDEVHLDIWHHAHQKYLSASPLIGYKRFLAKIKISPAEIEEISESISLIRRLSLVDDYIDDLKNHIMDNASLVQDQS